MICCFCVPTNLLPTYCNERPGAGTPLCLRLGATDGRRPAADLEIALEALGRTFVAPAAGDFRPDKRLSWRKF